MSSESLRLKIAAMFMALGEFYRVEVSRPQAEAYARTVEDVPVEKLAAAMAQVQRTSKFFPMPAEIREIALGSAKDEALEASSRIVEAMGEFGWTQPESARAFIGELGWRVVEREGGWKAICERTTNDDLPTLKAQWRELARATHVRVSAGRDEIAPALGQKPSPAVSGLLPEITKTMPGSGHPESTEGDRHGKPDIKFLTHGVLKRISKAGVA